MSQKENPIIISPTASRKYISEYALNKFGDYVVLLQQDDLDKLNKDKNFINNPCHIYMIGRRPRVGLDTNNFQVTDTRITGRFYLQKGNAYHYKDFTFQNNFGTPNLKLVCTYPNLEFSLVNDNGDMIFRAKTAALASLTRSFGDELDFEVLYIGQSYGKDGSRRAHERLENHSTLQKIYYEAIQRSPDKEIWLMLWGFSPLLLGNIDGKSKEYRVSDEDDDAHSNLVFQKGISE